MYLYLIKSFSPQSVFFAERKEGSVKYSKGENKKDRRVTVSKKSVLDYQL